MIDSLDGRKFLSPNLVHQFPKTTTLVRNFLNFIVKKRSFDIFNYLLEFLPIFKTSWRSIVIERVTTFLHPPLFGMLGDFWFLGIFCSCLSDKCSKLVDCAFQFFGIINVRHVHVFEVQNNVFNECSFLVTFWGHWEFRYLDDLFRDRKINRERSVIWG